jgi:hypothetical protein
MSVVNFNILISRKHEAGRTFLRSEVICRFSEIDASVVKCVTFSRQPRCAPHDSVKNETARHGNAYNSNAATSRAQEKGRQPESVCPGTPFHERRRREFRQTAS